MGGMLNMKLKRKPAFPAKMGINAFTEPCVFKAKPASKSMKVPDVRFIDVRCLCLLNSWSRL